MNWTERRERFRAIISGNRCVHPGSVYDAISARIAEDLGFEVGMFSGSIGSMSVLGAPDLVVLTLTEFAGKAHRICRAGNGRPLPSARAEKARDRPGEPNPSVALVPLHRS
jgi:carboxyvinyl-carboxyphosphonate phosphorylmutase